MFSGTTNASSGPHTARGPHVWDPRSIELEVVLNLRASINVESMGYQKPELFHHLDVENQQESRVFLLRFYRSTTKQMLYFCCKEFFFKSLLSESKLYNNLRVCQG